MTVLVLIVAVMAVAVTAVWARWRLQDRRRRQDRLVEREWLQQWIKDRQ